MALMHDQVESQAKEADAPPFIAEFHRPFTPADISWAVARWDAYVVSMRGSGIFFTPDDIKACVPLYAMTLASETVRLNSEAHP